MRQEVDEIDRRLVRLLAERRRVALAIGRVKASRGLPVHAPDREDELLSIVREEAVNLGLDPAYVEGIFIDILADSRAAQRRARRAS